MSKIILYGVGVVFRCFEKDFLDLQKENKIQIIGVADKALAEETFHGFHVVQLSEIPGLDIDYIIITAQDPAANSIYNDLCANGIPKEKIIGIDNYKPIEEKLARDAREQLPTQLEIIQKILRASDEDAGSFEWMRDVVGRYGIYPWSEADMNRTDNVVPTRAGMLQDPNEFAKYCVYLSHWKIDTAIEVGVFRGRSSYFMCALLARKNPSLVYELVDIADNLDFYEEFHKLLPQMVKRIPSTSENYIGQAYDFVFIDAEHSYGASMADYKNLGQYAKKLIVFHDIYAHEYDHLDGGTVRTWKEVMDMTPKQKHHVFSEHPDLFLGIGVLEHM